MAFMILLPLAMLAFCAFVWVGPAAWFSRWMQRRHARRWLTHFRRWERENPDADDEGRRLCRLAIEVEERRLVENGGKQ